MYNHFENTILLFWLFLQKKSTVLVVNVSLQTDDVRVVTPDVIGRLHQPWRHNLPTRLDGQHLDLALLQILTLPDSKQAEPNQWRHRFYDVKVVVGGGGHVAGQVPVQPRQAFGVHAPVVDRVLCDFVLLLC